MAGTSTKERLLEAALDLFSQRGYSATSVDEIAESIGIKGPNIYKYFKGKEALLYAITDYSVTKYKEKMSMNIDISKLVHNKEELREFSLNQIKYTLTNNDIIRLRKMYTLEQFRDEHMRSMMTRQQYTAIMDIYIKIFTELVRTGQIKSGEPDILAIEYISPTSLLIQLCDREPSRIDEAMDMITRHIDFFIGRYCK